MATKHSPTILIRVVMRVNESQSMEMMFSKRSAQARVSGDEALGIEGGGCDGRVRQEKKGG
jgi:hypothetical protein